MNIFDIIAEQKIQAAIQDGSFDNLRGAGKPIEWNDNPLAPEDEKMAFDLLQKNGFTLTWIEQGNEIRKMISSFRDRLRNWFLENHSITQNDILPLELLDMLTILNRNIFDYNRNVPVEALQVSFIDANRELNLIIKKFPDSM